jgi:4-hydroxybenzoate polyprenyltransferase
MFLGPGSARSRERSLAGGIASSKASLLFDFSHSRQAVLSVAQPGLAALLALGGFPSLRIVGLGLVASTAGMLCVYASNDLLDLRVDREAVRSPTSPKISEGYDIDVVAVRHPVAVGVLSVRLAIAWVVALGLIALGFAYWLRPGCALIFAGCVCLEVVYCALKRRTWLKTIPAGAMVGLGALAGWYAVRDFDLYALAFFFLLAFWEIFGRNLTNDLADRSHDAPLGIKTLATVHGPKWSARVILVGTTAVLPLAALQQGSLYLRLLMVATAVWTMTLPALGLVRSPQEKESQRMFNRASLFLPLAFLVALVYFAVGRAL